MGTVIGDMVTGDKVTGTGTGDPAGVGAGAPIGLTAIRITGATRTIRTLGATRTMREVPIMGTHTILMTTTMDMDIS